VRNTSGSSKDGYSVRRSIIRDLALANDFRLTYALETIHFCRHQPTPRSHRQYSPPTHCSSCTSLTPFTDGVKLRFFSQVCLYSHYLPIPTLTMAFAVCIAFYSLCPALQLDQNQLRHSPSGLGIRVRLCSSLS